MTAKSLLGSTPEAPQQLVTTPPPIVGQGGGQTLSALTQGDIGKQAMMGQETDIRKKRRMGLLGV